MDYTIVLIPGLREEEMGRFRNGFGGEGTNPRNGDGVVRSVQVADFVPTRPASAHTLDANQLMKVFDSPFVSLLV